MATGITVIDDLVVRDQLDDVIKKSVHRLSWTHIPGDEKMTGEEAEKYVKDRGWVEHRPYWYSHPDHPEIPEGSISTAIEYERKQDKQNARSERSSGHIIFAIGKARSGKSTFVKRWIREPDPEGRVKAIFCSDDIRMAIHGNRYKSLAEPMVFGIKQVVLRAHMLRGDLLFCDGTHSTEDSIKRILEVDMNAEPMIFDTPLEVCLQRARDTNQLDLLSVIPRHHRQIQKLLAEGIHNVMERLKEEIKEKRSYDGGTMV